MPTPQIQFPAGFTTASALAYTTPDGSAQLVTAENPMPVTSSGAAGGGLSDAELRRRNGAVLRDAPRHVRKGNAHKVRPYVSATWKCRLNGMPAATGSSSSRA